MDSSYKSQEYIIGDYSKTQEQKNEESQNKQLDQVEQIIEDISDKDGMIPSTIINDQTQLKKNLIRKIKQQDINTKVQQVKDKTLFRMSQTYVKLNFRQKYGFIVKKYFSEKEEYLNEICHLKDICSKNTSITLPLIDYGEENGIHFIEQQAGQKNLKMLKESFIQNACFCQIRIETCKYCFKIDEYISYLFIQQFNKLKQLHEIGIAHSDIKPQNIVYGYDNQTYLIDFGSSVKLSEKQKYLQQFTYTYNLNQYFTCKTIEKGKKSYTMKFKFESENQIKQCDRSQLAITWLYMNYRTYEEEQLFNEKDYNNLLELIYKRNQRNKLLSFISIILNEADPNIKVFHEKNNIEQLIINCCNELETKDNSVFENKEINEQQQGKTYNIFFDPEINLQIANYQKDIIFESNLFKIKRVNEYSLQTILFLDRFIKKMTVNPYDLQLKPLVKSDEYNQFCEKYNITNTYFTEQSYYDYMSYDQKYNFFQQLKATKDKIIYINITKESIADFKNIIESVNQAVNRQSLQINLNYINYSYREIIDQYKVLENEYPNEDMQLQSLYTHQSIFHSLNIILKFTLIKQKNTVQIEKNKQFIILLAQLQQPTLISVQQQFQNYQYNLEEIIEILLQRDQKNEFKNRIKIFQNRLKWITQKKNDCDLQNYTKKSLQLQQNLTKKLHYNPLEYKNLQQQPFNEQDIKFYIIKNKLYEKYQEKYETLDSLAVFLIHFHNNNINYTFEIENNTLFDYFQILPCIYLENLEFNLVYSSMKLSEIIQKIQNFINILPTDCFYQVVTVINSFAFEDIDFFQFIKSIINLHKQLKLKIILIDCIYSQDVLTELLSLQKNLKESQFIYEKYDQYNKEYNQISTWEYILSINFNQNELIENSQLIIKLLNLTPQLNLNMNPNEKETRKDDIQNENIIYQTEIGRILEKQNSLQFDGNNKIQLKTENYNFIFNIQNIYDSKEGNISIKDFQEIIEKLEQGIHYEEIQISINDFIQIQKTKNQCLEIKMFENKINVEIIQLLFRFGFLMQKDFYFKLYIKTNQHIQINYYLGKQSIKYDVEYIFEKQESNISKEMNQYQNLQFSKNKESILLDQNCLTLMTQLFKTFEEFIKQYQRNFEFYFYQNISDCKAFESQFQLTETYFQNQCRRYYFQNSDFTNEFIQVLYNTFKSYKEGFLALEFIDTQITIAGFIQFIESLLQIETDIGIIIVITEVGDIKIFQFLDKYFQKYTKIIQNNDYIQIILFPSSPKLFIEIVIDESFNFKDYEHVTQNNGTLTNKLQSIYGQTCIDQVLKYSTLLSKKFIFKI